MHQYRALTGQYSNPLGLALAHPLLIAAGRALRVFGDANLPTAMNLLSGVGMAVAVANVFLLGVRLTGRRVPAVLAATMLAVAHTPWWLATITETYTWVAAGLTTELLLLVWLLRNPHWRTAALLGLVSGLGLSLHNFALLPLPVYAVAIMVLVVRRRLPTWAPAAVIGGWLIGAAGLGTLVIGQGMATGDWVATIHSALFGEAWQSDVLGGSAEALSRAGMYIGLNWPIVSLLPVLMGWWFMPRVAGRAVGTALGTVAAIHLIFAMRYPVADQFMFLLPSYTLLAVGAAVGFHRIDSMRPRWRTVCMALVLSSIAVTPILYATVPRLLTAAGRSIRPGRKWPYRDENRYWITPWKHNEDSARRFAAAAFERAEPEAIVLWADMASFPLQVSQLADGQRPDMRIVPFTDPLTSLYETDRPAFAEAVAGRPCYTVNATPSRLPRTIANDVQTEHDGVLLRVRFGEPGAEP